MHTSNKYNIIRYVLILAGFLLIFQVFVFARHKTHLINIRFESTTLSKDTLKNMNIEYKKPLFKNLCSEEF
jgi:hypothetical protein